MRQACTIAKSEKRVPRSSPSAYAPNVVAGPPVHRIVPGTGTLFCSYFLLGYSMFIILILQESLEHIVYEIDKSLPLLLRLSKSWRNCPGVRL